MGVWVGCGKVRREGGPRGTKALFWAGTSGLARVPGVASAIMAVPSRKDMGLGRAVEICGS